MSAVLDSTTRPAASKPIFSDETFFELALFLVPVLGAFKLKFSGDLLFSDLVIPFLVVIAMIARGLPSNRIALAAMGASVLWFGALVVSDVVNQSTPYNYLRGWARDGLACCYLAFFMCALRPTARSLSLLSAGLGLALIIAMSSDPKLNLEHFMKFGGGFGIAWLLCAAAVWQWRAGRPLLPVFALFILMLAELSQNVRSLMVIVFVVAVLMLTAYFGHSRLRRVSLPSLLAILLIGGGAFGVGIAMTYGSVASSGILGKGAQNKYLSQSRGGDFTSVWNARPELRVALAIVVDNPWLGHGSWYHDPKIAAAELLFDDYTNLSNTNTIMSVSEGGQATGHSSLLQAWVESGIVGACFWLCAIIACLGGVMRSLQYPTILSPIGFLAAIDFMWDALFSPFGGIQRITSMSELAVVVTCMAASARVMTREKSVSGGI